MESNILLAIVLAILGSSGVFAFIQFLISRRDTKDKKLDDITKDIKSLKDDIQEMKSQFSDDISKLDDKLERSQAIQARIRILRCNDELRQNIHHSYEYFRQTHSDITYYENYCLAHPGFKNNEAVNSIEYINRVYQDCLDSNNFLD